ncbi:MAG TPA: SusC/RagA family TonB-linked outer membrane protein [Saprospiraceae bacterium]|nr:SusC/RagA family TonB-linked outer membrane protein [Saprospiraceae bacterium]
MKLRVDYCSKWVLAVLILCLGSFTYAQRTISGKVTDQATGEPLIGANILAVGTSTGTVTDIDGTYSINVPNGTTQLDFSYTGYSSQRITLGASNVVDIALSAGSVLEEVVVVGYGTQRSREVTSAVTSVKADDFNMGNVNDPTQLIQGKVAGLQISKVGGDPNGGTTIRLRGLSTIGANTSPLIVIDGVIGATLESVDPNDIESVDVLKDGSAAAIYGSRGSSGVILITTKKGVKGATKVEYNGYVAAESIAKRVETASASEFRRLRPTSDRGANTDWVDEVTRTGISHVHNLSLSGGTGGGTTYRASLNFRGIEGIAKVSDFQQLNGRLNLTQKALNDRMTLSANIASTRRDANFGFTEALRYAVLYNPTAPVLQNPSSPLFNKYGGFYQEENFDFFNPVAIQQQGTNIGITNDLLLSGRVDYKIIEGLTISGFYSQLRETEQYREYYQKQAYFRGFNRNGLARGTDIDRNTQLFETTLNYNAQFGKTFLTALAGYSWQDIEDGSLFIETGNFISDDVSFNRLNFSQDRAQGRANFDSFRSNYRVIGFFGRVNLNFDDTYFLMASLRREGSTRFGENNQWGLFPAVSAGVTLSNLFDVSGVDNLKLRVGYGETGALPPGNGLSRLLFTQRGSFFFNGNFVPAFAPARNANPDLKWETKGEFNAGLDFALLDYKLTGSLDYYIRRTRDLIYEIVVPVPPNLAERTWSNLEDAILRNSGVELSLGYRFDKGRDFSWEPRLVFSTYNTVLDTVDATDAKFKFFTGGGIVLDPSTSPGAPGLNNNPTVAVIAGQQLGQIWGPTFDRIGEDGSFVFRDVNGDGVVNEDDFSSIGNGLPTFSIGFNNSFRYKNFDFNFFVRGDFGHDLVNMYRVFYEPLGSRPIENTVKTKYFDENLTATPQFSSRYVENASYLALDNATLGYTINLGDKSKISRMRVYLTGQNLFFITNYTGVDPSPRFGDAGDPDNGGFQGFNQNPLHPGLDRRNTYFRTRTITFGLNLGF